MSKLSKDEISKFYKLGYERGYKTAILHLKERGLKENYPAFFDNVIEDLLNYYNSYPIIMEKIE